MTDDSKQWLHIEISNWACDIVVPGDWTIDTVAEIIKKEIKYDER